MAHVLELFGPPGVGKSALARALDGRRVAGRRIVGVERLLRVPRWFVGEGLVRTFPHPPSVLSRVALRVLATPMTARQRRSLLEARRDGWGGLLTMIQAGLARHPEVHAGAMADPLRALEAPGWLASSLELRALAEDAPDRFHPVLSEGLVQRTSIVCGDTPSDDELRSYLAALPAGGTHIRLSAPTDVVVGRLLARERAIYRHLRLGREALAHSVEVEEHLFTRSEELLRSSGARVIAVTALGTPDEIADEIVASLATIDR